VESLFPFVEETVQFALSGSNVLCKFKISKDLSTCDFDRNQIGQVIDNIVINAKQAMPDGGTIVLSAENIKVGPSENPQLAGGDYIRISLRDSGIGMDKEILTRIFDPFYTTKASGHGLGLASCYSIVKRHGGCIDVESEPGKGSIFQIFLPASKEIVSSSPEISISPHKGTGTFLVMDDEEVILNTFRTILEKFGYEVICKKNGKEAIDFVSSEIDAKREIRGMIFDLTIPGGMGGREAIDEIRKMNVRAPAFVTSGYAEDPIMANPAEYGFTASLSKPFRKVELSVLLNKHIK
jgi:CheY-like chemotaxis protein